MGWTELGQTGEIGFATGAGVGDIEILGVWGRERISRLYEFNLLLYRHATKDRLTEEELDKVLHAPCTISMGPEKTDAVHGILSHIELVDDAPEAAPHYLARLVPTVWLLTLTRTSRVFLDKTTAEIVKEVLEKYGLHGAKQLQMTGGETKRPYVVQYQESDWDFLQRWLEREGLFYYFAQDPDNKTERLVIADANTGFSDIGGTKDIAHRGYTNLENYKEDTIWDFHLRRQRTPARVALYDYHDQKPNELITAAADVDAKLGFGTVFGFGEHLLPDEDAAQIAKRRAERLACEKLSHAGRTTCARFKAGHVFSFDGEEHVITSIEHRIGHPLYTSGSQAMSRYFGRFEAIPRSAEYRPARVTPWPRIDGVLSAHIDADTPGKYAYIDDQGRYWVKMPFDLSDTVGKKASCAIRMAQAYTGGGYGIHYPLHKGAEVLVAHVGGDPDRPVIVGAIPNPVTASVVVDKNLSQSVVNTASNIRIELEDQQG